MLPFYQQELKVGADGEEDRLMFIWPMTIVHKINEKSPLYNLTAEDMLKERFEIVVMLGKLSYVFFYLLLFVVFCLFFMYLDKKYLVALPEQ